MCREYYRQLYTTLIGQSWADRQSVIIWAFTLSCPDSKILHVFRPKQQLFFILLTFHSKFGNVFRGLINLWAADSEDAAKLMISLELLSK